MLFDINTNVIRRWRTLKIFKKKNNKIIEFLDIIAYKKVRIHVPLLQPLSVCAGLHPMSE